MIQSDATMSGSGFLEFKLDYSETKNIAIGDSVRSDDISAGGHLWRIKCYPRGNKEEDKGEYISLFLELISDSKGVKTIFQVFYLGEREDELPEDDELGGSPTEMVQHLLAAADRYTLDRLKLMCARKLWGIISVDTFASTLACAETHSCAELKSKCIDFFAVEKNFKKIVFTAGFMGLVQEFPDLAAKLKERVGI